MSILTPEDLLAGTAVIHEVRVPPDLLSSGKDLGSGTLQLRPLNIGVFQMIMKAARDDPGLIPLLLIKESLIEPPLTLGQVKQLHLGLVRFLIEQIREISGLHEKKNL